MKNKVDWREVLDPMPDGKLKLVGLSELLKKRTPREIRQLAQQESKYRSGYVHGYQAALEDLLDVSQREYSRVRECINWVHDFLYGPLMRWRYMSHGGSRDQPPVAPLPPKWTSQRAAVRRRDVLCVKCGASARLEVDHIVPVAQGGRAELENLRLLCGDCHSDRSRR